MKRRGKSFYGIQSTEDYPSISRKEAFKNIVKFKLQPTKVLNSLLQWNPYKADTIDAKKVSAL